MTNYMMPTKEKIKRPLMHALFITASVAGTIGLLTALIGPLAELAGGEYVDNLKGKERADAINAVRQTLLQASAGTIALIALAVTAMTFFLNRRGQVTDRYMKAIGLIGSEKLGERIGGVYALEQVMRESPQDHNTIIQVLAAFIRSNSPLNQTEADNVEIPVRQIRLANGWPMMAIHAQADIQAALSVLGRRPERPERGMIDLQMTNLKGANLVRGRFNDAVFLGADLRYSDLSGAQLNRADLSYCHLQGARLYKVSGNRASFHCANMRDSNIARANLDRADLSEADLAGADISWAILNHTKVRSANFENTKTSGVRAFNVRFDRARGFSLKKPLREKIKIKDDALGTTQRRVENRELSRDDESPY